MERGLLGVNTAEILPGKLHELRLVCEKLSRLTKEESGALEYEWWVHGEATLHIFERFVDSEAVLAHLENVGTVLNELAPCIRWTGSFVYGNVSEELGAAIGAGPCYMTKLGGFGGEDK